MTEHPTDRTGEPVEVVDDTSSSPTPSFRIDLLASGDPDSGTDPGGDPIPAGHAFYLDRPEDGERIFYHTEVEKRFGGRGLATVLVRLALDETRESSLTVVPVCPLVKSYLDEHGDDYRGEGGRTRAVRPADLEAVRAATSG